MSDRLTTCENALERIREWAEGYRYDNDHFEEDKGDVYEWANEALAGRDCERVDGVQPAQRIAKLEHMLRAASERFAWLAEHHTWGVAKTECERLCAEMWPESTAAERHGPKE